VKALLREKKTMGLLGKAVVAKKVSGNRKEKKEGEKEEKGTEEEKK
jgi:hypothetical protein